MTPEQFLSRLDKQGPAPVYLFVGQEAYQRKVCKEALISRVLTEDENREGITQTDLESCTLTEVLDDARSLSLFSQQRLIWVYGAESALPRRVTPVDEGQESGGSGEPGLASYLREPTPGTVVVFDCSRFDFTGDDKAKLDRVIKFYSAVPAVVELRHFTPESSRYLAQELAKERKLKIGGKELATLLEAVAGDASRLATEMEKLSLFTGPERSVTLDDLRMLVPNAAQTTIFALVNSIGKRDRAAALRSLDILVREGEYLPLALLFLSSHFRLALAAKEANVRSEQQAQAFFSKIGIRMWRDRAEQVVATAGLFAKEQLAKALTLIYETDKKFREGFRDDLIIMETLVFALTK